MLLFSHKKRKSTTAVKKILVTPVFVKNICSTAVTSLLQNAKCRTVYEKSNRFHLSPSKLLLCGHTGFLQRSVCPETQATAACHAPAYLLAVQTVKMSRLVSAAKACGISHSQINVTKSQWCCNDWEIIAWSCYGSRVGTVISCVWERASSFVCIAIVSSSGRTCMFFQSATRLLDWFGQRLSPCSTLHQTNKNPELYCSFEALADLFLT